MKENGVAVMTKANNNNVRFATVGSDRRVAEAVPGSRFFLHFLLSQRMVIQSIFLM